METDDTTEGMPEHNKSDVNLDFQKVSSNLKPPLKSQNLKKQKVD